MSRLINIRLKYQFILIIIISAPMAKQPTGQKKSKDQITKAASQKKAAGHKKWTKGKTKEKAEHAVFLDKESYDRMLIGIPKLGRHISVSSVVEKYKIVGSIARILLRTLEQQGTLKIVQKHSRQALYYPTVAPAEKVVEAQPTKKGKKQK